MPFAISLAVIAAALHLALGLPIGPAIIGGLVGTGILWLLWKARWIIVAIVGLEWIFGRNDSNEA